VRVEIWSGWTGNEARAFQRQVDRFNATHPRVLVENLGGVQDDTKTIRAITAGVPPDLFFLWNPTNLGPLVSNDALLPLDSLFGPGKLREDQFLPAALQMGRADGRLYCLPYLVDCTALFWNRDAFRLVGLDPDRPPQTLEELLDAAQRLTKRGASGSIQRLGLDLPDVQLIIVLFGGRLVDAQGRPTANDPHNVAAYRWYQELVKRLGGISQVDSFSAGFGQGQGPNHPFFVGKTAMMLSGEWIPWWVERYAPRLSYGVAPVPYPAARPDLRLSNLVGGNPLCISKESRHPKEALEFLRWVQTPEAQESFALAMNNVPNIRSVLHSPTLTQGSQRKRNYAQFLRLANSPNAQAAPVSPIMGYYINEMQNARDFVIHGHKTPEVALADVQRKVLAELSRANQGAGQ
jgi:multiple sugar transport system substrate-binding protein